MIKRLVKVNLPSEYQQVEYLEKSGRSWLEVCPIKTDDSFKIEALFTPVKTTTNNRQFLLGHNVSNATQTGFAINANGSITDNLKPIDYTKDTLYTCDFNSTNSTVTKTYNDLIYTITKPNNNGVLSLFKLYNWSNMNELAEDGTRCKYIKVKINGELVRNLIPCYRKSDNVKGMYDIISNTFFTKKGTGDFIVGEDVYEPIEVMKEIKAVKRYVGGQLKDITKINKVVNGEVKTIFGNESTIDMSE